MKYYLTEEQYNCVWQKSFDTIGLVAIEHNTYWEDHFFKKTKLSYIESYDDIVEIGYWGVLEGDEKDITWFLLQL
jgi:hypothetical protein